MKNLFFWLPALCFCLSVASCKNDALSFEPSSAELRFSRDTVQLDTVYSQIRSETYAFKVYNQEDRDIRIPKIALKGGANSMFRLNVDGHAGVLFTDVPLRKKDSLFVFVEIAPQPVRETYIALDDVLFGEAGTTQQKVTLRSVVQDAEFFIQQGKTPKVLSGNLNWTPGKAKVIYGDVVLAPNATLNIAEGTQVLFAKKNTLSSLKISSGATLNVNGSAGKEVIFRSDRSDPRYDTLARNWDRILAENNATINLNYAKMQGGTTGLELQNAQANIKNSIFHTFDEYGILAKNSTVSAQNLIINNCRNTSFAMLNGGNYNINHSTIINFWNQGSPAPAQALYATNEYQGTTGGLQQAALNLILNNSIVYSSIANALALKPTAGQVFNYRFSNVLLKYDAALAGFTLTNNPSVLAAKMNVNPLLLNVSSEKINLRVGQNSPAKNSGNAAGAQLTPQDYAQKSRSATPTLGAYE